jgi:hypothetical protein
MKQQHYKSMSRWLAWVTLAMLPGFTYAQVPVDDTGAAYGAKVEELGDEGIPRLADHELQELVGPIALYPDDLLAVVLPASTYPLQIIEAARFLERLEVNPTLKPDEDWDDSIVALINYPEVVELLNENLDWTWRLGEAVVAQQTDVIAAVETFRDRAYAAGNLKSDGYQQVTRNDGVVSISPVSEDVIYVPYYEPTRVVVRQPRPVYYYYPEPYPVYYYPYPSSYAFNRGYFWGVTTAFSIGWATHDLSVYHHSYYGHPYYGRSYWDRWWYRRPSITVYNNTYVRNTTNRVTVNNYYSGDQWRPSDNSGVVRRVTRTVEGRSGSNVRTTSSRTSNTLNNSTRTSSARTTVSRSEANRNDREKIVFRERPGISEEQSRNRISMNSSKQPRQTTTRQNSTRLPATSTPKTSAPRRDVQVRPSTQDRQPVTRQAQTRNPTSAKDARRDVQVRPSSPPRQASRPTTRQPAARQPASKPAASRPPSSRSPKSEAPERKARTNKSSRDSR